MSGVRVYQPGRLEVFVDGKQVTEPEYDAFISKHEE